MTFEPTSRNESKPRENSPSTAFWFYFIIWCSFTKGEPMPKRDRGTGGLIKLAGCRFYYAQFYRDRRQVRVSTRTEVKQEALTILRNLMSESDRGSPLAN